MKRSKALLAALLSVLMLVSVFALASCGETKTEEKTASTEAGSSAVDTGYQFSSVVYDGDFTVYSRSGAGSYNAKYIVAEETTGDIVNDATEKRNLCVENKYGVTIKWIESDSPSANFETHIQSGDVEYDLILDCRNSLSKFATKGYLYDFNSLETDFSQEWWDTNCIRDLEIKGHSYLMQNSISIARITGTRFFYFNKDIITNYHLDNPYDLLENNQWTLENFVKMCKGITNVGADTALGVHAMVLETGSSNGVYMHMLVGCGVEYSSVNEDGEVVLTISDNIEKIDDVFSTLKALFDDPTHVITMDKAVALDTNGVAVGSNKYDKSRSLFTQGHFLFTHGSIAVSEDFIDMESDYGCMPNPKYDENQEDYAHKCDPYTLIFAIPNSNSIDMTRVAAIMEYWGYESENEVIPAYYDVTIKSRRMSDTTAQKVVDLVKNSVRYEITDVYKLGNIPSTLEKGYKNGSVSSQWKSASEECLKQVQTFNESIED